jgi:NitT/TauT family transport system permease protein
VAACALAIFFAIVSTGVYWLGKPVPVVPISHSIGALPLYAFYSIVRMGIAYLLSLIFAVAYGYIAAYNPALSPGWSRSSTFCNPFPCSAFCLPSCWPWWRSFPAINGHRDGRHPAHLHRPGVEPGLQLLLLAQSIPREMIEASRIYRYSAWQRFWQLEMPYAAIGLVWNSIVSVAGGWFALIACEMFTMGERNFQLPGLGSYLQTATYAGDVHALLWPALRRRHSHRRRHRPAGLASAHRLERQIQIRAGRVRRPASLAHPRTAAPLHASSNPSRPHLARLEEPIYRRMAQPRECRVVQPLDEEAVRQRKLSPALAGRIGVLSFAGERCRPFSCCARHLARPAPAARGRGRHLSARQRRAAHLRRCGRFPSASPSASTRGSPASSSRSRRSWPRFRPLPFFPILLIGLVKIGGGLGIGSIALMLLGTQWYILFNVIAGAMSIPSDLREVASLYHFTRWQRWTKLILPGIFPYLITGMVTASGGAWNASSWPSTPTWRPHPANHRPGRADQTPPPTAAAFPSSAAGHHPDLAHGRHHEPPGLAPPLPPGRNPV